MCIQFRCIIFGHSWLKKLMCIRNLRLTDPLPTSFLFSVVCRVDWYVHICTNKSTYWEDSVYKPIYAHPEWTEFRGLYKKIINLLNHWILMYITLIILSTYTSHARWSPFFLQGELHPTPPVSTTRSPGCHGKWNQLISVIVIHGLESRWLTTTLQSPVDLWPVTCLFISL